MVVEEVVFLTFDHGDIWFGLGIRRGDRPFLGCEDSRSKNL